MDIHVGRLRDRRIAAADENLAMATPESGGRRQIYGTGTQERRLSERPGARSFDVRCINPQRAVQRINSVFLHHTGFCSSHALPEQAADDDINSDHRLDSVIAHFVVRTSGEILYLRDVQRVLNSVSGARGIDIEFEGNYNQLPEGFRHRDWADLQHPLQPRLSKDSLQSGRRLLRALRTHPELDIRFIHPHSQVTAKYCPGPDIWMNLGEWAKQQFGWQSSRAGLRDVSERIRHSAYL